MACGCGRAFHELVDVSFHATWEQAAAEALPVAALPAQRQNVGQMQAAVRSAGQVLPALALSTADVLPRVSSEAFLSCSD